MLNQSLIPEFQQETASTKKMLGKVPDGKFDWKPHGKSMSLGKLASHIANIPNWMTLVLTTDEFDFAKGGYKEENAASQQELASTFESNYQKALQTLQNASDETLRGSWTLRGGDHVFFTLPRIAAVRTLAMNHLLHHRGQLSVYLRLLDVPVPGMYGPSADEM
ncbi:DinB family protein [Flavisolibacter nicotianae]|uniref:DinB family protein n=1 Tax=Flavisolibacter nicotianae TaxID=2364882 RepID=UPI000EB41A1F|nr:DinB family protein [Flavisolibacter nicotianae]